MSNKVQATPCHPYPDEAWGPGLRELILTPTPYLPVDWRRRALPDAPPNEDETQKECDVLVEYAKCRPDYKKEIHRQARKPLAAIRPVQDCIGDIDLSPKHAVKKLIGAVLDNIQGPVYYYKEHFARNRPGACCEAKGLVPMFPAGPPAHPAHPAHPAYPSGHATMAYAVAFVYIELLALKDADKQALLDAAQSVARNREIAGLHYPSDSLAGQVLAEKLVGMMVNHTDFKQLMDAAKDELGTITVKAPPTPKPCPPPIAPTPAPPSTDTPP